MLRFRHVASTSLGLQKSHPLTLFDPEPILTLASLVLAKLGGSAVQDVRTHILEAKED
jgi:hypothetical protein